MMKIRYVFPALAFLLILSFSSCRKSRREAEPAKTLFTVEFADNYIKKQLSGFIMISDPEGRILGDTICNANGRYPVFLKSSSPVPSTLTVTVGYYEVIMHILTIHLATYTNVAPYGSWKIKGILPDTLGHIFLSLQNLPTLSGPVIYSNAGYSNLTSKTSDVEQMLYQSPDDIYVKIKTPAGDKFKWIPGAQLSGNYILDMSDAAASAIHTISLPFIAEDYDISVSGVRDSNYSTRIPVLTDRVISNGALSSVELAYPPSVFQGFLTDLMIRESYSSDLRWFHHIAGSLPDQFVKVDAAISSVDAAAGRVTLNTSGTYSMTAINWQFLDKDHTLYDWYIFGPAGVTELSLPEISPGIAKKLPALKLDSMACVSAELCYYPNLSNYSEVLRLQFDPERVSSPGEFEMRSVRKILSGKKLQNN